jgi:hypothetical protein
MLKKVPSGVLSRKRPQRTPEGTPPALASPAALLDDLFEHPALLLTLFSYPFETRRQEQSTNRLTSLLSGFRLERRFVLQCLRSAGGEIIP